MEAATCMSAGHSDQELPDKTKHQGQSSAILNAMDRHCACYNRGPELQGWHQTMHRVTSWHQPNPACTALVCHNGGPAQRLR